MLFTAEITTHENRLKYCMAALTHARVSTNSDNYAAAPLCRLSRCISPLRAADASLCLNVVFGLLFINHCWPVGAFCAYTNQKHGDLAYYEDGVRFCCVRERNICLRVTVTCVVRFAWSERIGLTGEQCGWPSGVQEIVSTYSGLRFWVRRPTGWSSRLRF